MSHSFEAKLPSPHQELSEPLKSVLGSDFREAKCFGALLNLTEDSAWFFVMVGYFLYI